MAIDNHNPRGKHGGGYAKIIYTSPQQNYSKPNSLQISDHNMLDRLPKSNKLKLKYLKPKKKIINKIILHVPHSCSALPEKFLNNKFTLPLNDIKKFNLTITDLYVKNLFTKNYTDKLTSKTHQQFICFEFSRVFCDVEKYSDDNYEPMSKHGMGCVYTHNHLGQQFFKPDDNYKNYILNNIYLPYHKSLQDKVNKSLKTTNVVLLDCHSFSAEIVMDNIDKTNLPDICIGVNNDKYTSQKLTNFVVDYFKNCNYSVAINYPYSGSMQPQSINHNNNKFTSIMIEINKRIYLTDNKPNQNFYKLHKQIVELLNQIEYFEF